MTDRKNAEKTEKVTGIVLDPSELLILNRASDVEKFSSDAIVSIFESGTKVGKA